jgi:HAD superfamily hydrolase (TIGR01509 family)
LNTYDAILFDFDGVLVDSEPVHFECWSEILGDFGLSLKWESWAAECIGVSDRQMLERMSKQVHPAIDVETLYATYPRKRDRFRQLMEERMPFFDGARELFESLHGYRLALVTSSGRLEVEPVLRKAGLFEYFDATVCFGEVARIKPAPDPYLKAAELVDARRPLVVEDSDAGVESGRAAGFDVLRIVSPAQVPGALRQKLGM